MGGREIASEFKVASIDCGKFSSGEASPRWAWKDGRKLMISFVRPNNVQRIRDYPLKGHDLSGVIVLDYMIEK